MLNIGIIGAKRGLVLAELVPYLHQPVQISAIADISEKYLQDWKEKYPDISLYTDENSLFEDSTVDIIYIATPINFHVGQSVKALKAGKHVLCEVPACTSIEEGQELINTVHKTGLTYMMAENYCFIPQNMLIGDLCNRGEFGDIVYVKSSYIHDCKALFFNKKGERLTWRGEMKRYSGGHDYPTHSIGPVAQWLNICRENGDSFKRITTFGSSQKSWSGYIKKRFGTNHVYAKENYFPLNDGIFTIIETEKGIIIELFYDLYSNRPPNKADCVLQGTKGSYISGRYDDEEGIIWLNSYSQEKDNREYVPLSSLQKCSDNKRNNKIKQLGKHYADYMMLNEFISSIVERRQPGISVYDAVAWSSIIPLSKKSILNGNIPIKFPLFEVNKLSG